MTAFSDSLIVYSMWKGYLDKTHSAFDEYKSDWIAAATANGSKFFYLHTSGHATADDIKRVCEITNAKIILPIHSEDPKAFLSLGLTADIKTLQDGESITI